MIIFFAGWISYGNYNFLFFLNNYTPRTSITRTRILDLVDTQVGYNWDTSSLATHIETFECFYMIKKKWNLVKIGWFHIFPFVIWLLTSYGWSPFPSHFSFCDFRLNKSLCCFRYYTRLTDCPGRLSCKSFENANLSLSSTWQVITDYSFICNL